MESRKMVVMQLLILHGSNGEADIEKRRGGLEEEKKKRTL